jgi:hypothetical protein
MTEIALREELPLEHLEFRFHAAGPIELDALGECFIALSRAFDRHTHEHFPAEPRPQVKLYVTRVEQGSIIATIVPYLVMLAEPIAWMSATNTIKSFSTNFIALLKRYAGDEKSTVAASIDDSKLLQQFLKPLTGRKHAELGITHARYESKDGTKEIIVEYRMLSPELNIAASNAAKIIETEEASKLTTSKHIMKNEVRMRLFQTNDQPGKEKGRTGDRAIVPDISDRDLPLYFPQQSNEYKRQILERTENPFQKNYIVDVNVEYDGDIPKMYRLIHIHQIVDP